MKISRTAMGWLCVSPMALVVTLGLGYMVFQDPCGMGLMLLSVAMALLFSFGIMLLVVGPP